VGPETFRDFFGSVPTATAVVTTMGPDGEPTGFTCSAFCAVSLDPALLLVSAGRQSRTLPAMIRSGTFALHLLSAEAGEDLARSFARRSSRKFKDVGWRPGDVVTACPVLLEGVLGHVECSLERSVPAGDHTLLIGRMEHAVLRKTASPLLYQQGVFTPWHRMRRRSAIGM
jgi:flavin reductase (DIM6/NTAB) family NADH-FMN oxidoreductase RutF